MDIYDEVFDKHIGDVKSGISTGKDSAGVAVKLKLDKSPSGEFEDDANWLDAGEEGVTFTKTKKSVDGRTRSKSLGLSSSEAEDCRKVVAAALGIETAKKKKRGTKADTLESEVELNGKPE